MPDIYTSNTHTYVEKLKNGKMHKRCEWVLLSDTEMKYTAYNLDGSVNMTQTHKDADMLSIWKKYHTKKEPFDKAEYEKRHAERLYKAIVDAFDNSDPAYRGNLKATALHYLCSNSMNYNPAAKKKLEDFIKGNLGEYIAPHHYANQAEL